MELLIGLLIGIAWGAGFSSFVHWAHGQEKVEKTESADRISKGLDKPRPIWELKNSEFSRELDKALHVNTADAVDRLDNTPPDCSCDWQGDQLMCEEEPRVWYRTRRDLDCPVHKDGDACASDYDKMVKSWLKYQVEPDESH